ncbi:MAG: HD domain-containing protein [Alphaproteobacteria bacterium]|nr:HD domain-containing protein [Alphaproteobacteria bacterium]
MVLEFLEFVEADAPRSVARLLDRFLTRCRQETGAEAGTIYVMRRRGRVSELIPSARQFGSSPLRGTPPPMPLNAATIAGYVASSGDVVRLADVRRVPAGKPFAYDSAVDIPGCRTQSLLCLPVRNFQGGVIAIVELVNRRTADGAVTAFSAQQIDRLLPVATVMSGYIQRTDNLEQIQAKNLKLRQRNRALARQRARIGLLQEETEEAFKTSIKLLARAAEIHDEGTGNHIVRVNEYSHYLAQCLGMHREFCDEIRYSAQLHDVGKLSIDHKILNKGGELNTDERAEMDRHPIFGYQILSPSYRLKMAAEIALFHHEKWDGTGYPHGVKGEEIPLSARIVSLADTYDALRSKRSYKPGFSHRQAVDVIVKGDTRIDPKGHFDPHLVELFAKNHEGFDKIWRKFTD